MKVIPKFQRGGTYDQYFTSYTPIQSSGESSPQRTIPSSTSEKGELTQKDFFEMLKDINGLPNEMSKIVNNLLNTFKLSNLTGISTDDLASSYLKNLYEIKIAAQNQKRYEEVLSNAQKNGSLAEPAISMDGRIIIQNEDGSIKPISVDTYNSNRDKYSGRVLTVSNLANMRKYDPQLVNNQSVFEIINNSMGYEAFQELLSKAIQSLGSTEITKNGMFSVEGKASKGLALLQTLSEDDRLRAYGSVTAQGLYEYKIIDKNQLSQINALTSYIATVLPDRAKTWASLKTGQSDKIEATKNLVLTYLLGRAQSSHSFDIQYKGSIEDLSSSKKEASISNDIIQNTPTKWLRGLGTQEIITINSGTNYAIQAFSNTLPLTDSDKKYLGANSLLQQASQGEYSPILDFNSASMGMQRIDPSNFGKIVLTDGKISSVDFPYKILEDGTIVPDLSPQTAESKQAADRELKQLGINLSDTNSISANYDTINNIYVKHGLQPAYNPDGTPANNWARFGVINAAASNNALGMDQFDSNELLQPINNDAVVDNLLQITKEENYDTNNFLWNGVDHFYRGTVWIPVKVSYIAASANTGMKTEQLNDIINREATLNASKMLTKEKK